MDLSQIEKYASVMKEIKLRTEVIVALSTGKAHSVYQPSTLESIGLQFRKCFELVAFASLAANREQYSAVYTDFAKHWEAAKLIKNLKRINPDFYPVPVVESPTTIPGVEHQLVKRQGDFLSVEELIEAHGRCGVLMHSANPFGQEIDYSYFSSNFPRWHSRMINLLNNHEVRLLDDTGMFLVHMKEVGHDEVRWYRFERASSPPNPNIVM